MERCGYHDWGSKALTLHSAFFPLFTFVRGEVGGRGRLKCFKFSTYFTYDQMFPIVNMLNGIFMVFFKIKPLRWISQLILWEEWWKLRRKHLILMYSEHQLAWLCWMEKKLFFPSSKLYFFSFFQIILLLQTYLCKICLSVFH